MLVPINSSLTDPSQSIGLVGFIDTGNKSYSLGGGMLGSDGSNTDYIESGSEFPALS